MALKPQGPDTSPEAERVQLALLRQASTAKRFARARSLSQTTIDLSRRAIRRANPMLSEEEVLIRFVALHYGQDLADRVQDHLRHRRA